jgi:hypothetical protein
LNTGRGRSRFLGDSELKRISILVLIALFGSSALNSHANTPTAQRRNRHQNTAATERPYFTLQSFAALPPVSINVLPAPVEYKPADIKAEIPEKPEGLSERITAWSTAVLAIFTAFLWLVTRDVVLEAGRTSKRQLRAYVLPNLTKVGEIPGKLQFHVQMHNFGSTPAYDLRYWIRSDEGHVPLQKELPVGVYTLQGYLAPGVPLELIDARDFGFGDQVARIRDKTSVIYVHGEVKYRDIFKRQERTTTFRYVFNVDVQPGGPLVASNAGNEADGDDEAQKVHLLNMTSMEVGERVASWLQGRKRSVSEQRP